MSYSYPDAMMVEPSEQSKRICFVYSRRPYPMMRGDQLTVSHLLEFFKARGHAIDFFSVDVDGESKLESDAWLRERCRSVNFYKRSMASMIIGLIFSLFKMWPLQIGIFWNFKLSRDVKKALRSGEYDLLYVYYVRSAPVVFDVPKYTMGKTKTFLAMQLSQYLNTARIAENSSGFKRILYKYEAILMRRFEAKIWKSYDRIGLIGDKDVDVINSISMELQGEKPDNIIRTPHGTNVRRFKKAEPEEVVKNRVVFSGNMSYEPNVQAVIWFYENCWPHVKTSVSGAEFYIVGKDPDQRILSLAADSSIKVTGTVPEVASYIRSAAVCINPMLSAAGMQNKLIEYLSSGKAIVATSIANEGVGAGDTVIKVADDEKSFAEAVISLLRSDEERSRLGGAARVFCESFWSWEYHFKIQEAELLD